MAVNIPFNRDFEVPYGALETVAPGLRRITASNPGPFTFRGTGTYVVGEGSVAVIDPGPDMPEHVDALLSALVGETISHILITHTHNDHSPAARILKAETGAPSYGFGPHGSGKGEQGLKVEAGGDMDFVPDEFVRDGSVIEGADWSVSCLHTPGHTSNHICYSWDERKILFPGDHIMGWSTSIISPPDGDMGDYMRSLTKLLAREDALYCPTHGPTIADPHPLVKAFIAHRREREDKIMSCLMSGIETVAEMVPNVYADIAPSLHAAASRSLFATLMYLVEEDRAVALGPATIHGRYRPGSS
ncbi:MBL fold metallo-hydrolase [Ponticaulis sp.]|uniref:MBL fold metallo-hydrolase n=1 Tax=Ponticaulis sp. TaxID=2020902 RepID=UPI000C3D7A37|nr:MBL fold metallo-hydrolase [Ponticaulis sp.]MBN06132.1 MBL fold metallo-hydrolase [Ponticaulis sp.]